MDKIIVRTPYEQPTIPNTTITYLGEGQESTTYLVEYTDSISKTNVKKVAKIFKRYSYDPELTYYRNLTEKIVERLKDFKSETPLQLVLPEMMLLDENGFYVGILMEYIASQSTLHNDLTINSSDLELLTNYIRLLKELKDKAGILIEDIEFDNILTGNDDIKGYVIDLVSCFVDLDFNKDPQTQSKKELKLCQKLRLVCKMLYNIDFPIESTLEAILEKLNPKNLK